MIEIFYVCKTNISANTDTYRLSVSEDMTWVQAVSHQKLDLWLADLASLPITISMQIDLHSWLNSHQYKIQIKHHFFGPKVPFLGLFGQKVEKISINHHLETAKFLWTTWGLFTRIRYRIEPMSWLRISEKTAFY